MRLHPLLLLALGGCGTERAPRGTGDPAGAAAAPNDAAAVRFALAEQGRAIVRLESGAAGRAAPAVVLRVRDVPAEWAPSREARFGVGADRFDFAAGSPDGELVAWQGGGTHALLGIVAGRGGPPQVLDFFFDSRASGVQWSDAGPYLVARYTGPSGYAEARVYDAARGVRLRAPWEADCRLEDACEVTAVRWTAPGILAVTTMTPGAAPRTVTARVRELRPRPAAR